MKTKEDFVTRWADELTGLLLASFAEAKNYGESAKDGRFMIQQMKRARNLLERIYHDFAEPVPLNVPAKPTASNAPVGGNRTSQGGKT